MKSFKVVHYNSFSKKKIFTETSPCHVLIYSSKIRQVLWSWHYALYIKFHFMTEFRNSVHVFHMATIHQYDMIDHNFNRLHVWTGLFVIHGSVHLACLTLTRVLDSGCESSEDRTTLTQELCSSERDRTGTRLPFVCKTHGKEWRRDKWRKQMNANRSTQSCGAGR